MTLRSLSCCLALALLPALPGAATTNVDWATGTGFNDLNTPNPAEGSGQWGWKAASDLTVNGTPGQTTNVSVAPQLFTYNLIGPPDAAFLTGSTDTFWTSPGVAQTVLLSFEFDEGFGPGDAWVWMDVDAQEVHTFMAFDEFDNPLDLSGWAHFPVDASAGPPIAFGDYAQFTVSGVGNTIGTLSSGPGNLADPSNVLIPDALVARISVGITGTPTLASPTMTFLELGPNLLVELSTGFDDLADDTIAFGGTDDDWTLTAAPAGVTLGAASVTGPDPSWFDPSPQQSRWIAPPDQTSSSTMSSPVGDYTFAYTFDVSAGVLAAGPVLLGLYQSEDALLEVRLNGNVLASGLGDRPADGFSGAFWSEDPADFVAGANLLEVDVGNGAFAGVNPVALVVKGSVRFLPEPGAASIAAGVTALVALARRRRAR